MLLTTNKTIIQPNLMSNLTHIKPTVCLCLNEFNIMDKSISVRYRCLEVEQRMFCVPNLNMAYFTIAVALVVRV